MRVTGTYAQAAANGHAPAVQKLLVACGGGAFSPPRALAVPREFSETGDKKDNGSVARSITGLFASQDERNEEGLEGDDDDGADGDEPELLALANDDDDDRSAALSMNSVGSLGGSSLGESSAGGSEASLARAADGGGAFVRALGLATALGLRAVLDVMWAHAARRAFQRRRREARAEAQEALGIRGEEDWGEGKSKKTAKRK